MSDLADFILARIAEEETAARDLLRHTQEMEPALRHVKWLGGLVPGRHSWSDVRSMAARVLAECESKRRIIRLCGVDPHEPGALLLPHTHRRHRASTGPALRRSPGFR